MDTDAAEKRQCTPTSVAAATTPAKIIESDIANDIRTGHPPLLPESTSFTGNRRRCASISATGAGSTALDDGATDAAWQHAHTTLSWCRKGQTSAPTMSSQMYTRTSIAESASMTTGNSARKLLKA
eukprot:3162751-Amphidinium_carterae.1